MFPYLGSLGNQEARAGLNGLPWRNSRLNEKGEKSRCTRALEDGHVVVDSTKAAQVQQTGLT